MRNPISLSTEAFRALARRELANRLAKDTIRRLDANGALTRTDRLRTLRITIAILQEYESSCVALDDWAQRDRVWREIVSQLEADPQVEGEL